VDLLRVQREARLFNKRKGEWGRIGWTGLGASEVSVYSGLLNFTLFNFNYLTLK